MVRAAIMDVMFEIEISRDASAFIARIQSRRKGGSSREYRSVNFENILEQIMKDILDEFEEL